MLSLHSHISSSSSPNAERHTRAQLEGSQTFRKIGAGACGAIFAQDGASVVFKMAKSNDHSELWSDYVMHTEIFNHFGRFIIDDFRVPECYYFVPRDKEEYFNKNRGIVEAAEGVCNLPSSVLVTERIHPLPHSTRDHLIENYCAPRIQEEARADPANKDCLVRVYLGSMQGRTRRGCFSLRNLKLHLNQLLDLNLDVGKLARRMGTALAVMHWAAKTDARDVEFVLGSSAKVSQALGPEQLKTAKPLSYTGPASLAHEDFFVRVTELFVLDFNQVRVITLDDEGVAMAVDAWRINDPYYPRPLGETGAEREIWKAFVMSYLGASLDVLKEEDEGGEGEGGGDGEAVLNLPWKFILGITEVERKRKLSRIDSSCD
ncbi:hypothetical protein QBC44DRAFT_340714 [Cladorrhinum sp. PSN332]|nr:hypothetical protein QBC44DRAFT_340714 [Cladorrhinum sp. PSN332]